MRCTLKDIANATNLSISTVSHALNDRDDISLKTKELVRNVARSMGYVHDSVANGLRKGRSNIIGVLQDDLLNPYFSIMSNYINDALSEHGYHMLIFTQHGTKVTNDSLTEVISLGVDGLISFIEISDNPDDYSIIEKNHFPVVVLGRRSNVKCIGNVYSDDKKGVYIATKYLLDAGCKNLIYISDHSDITTVKDRQEGFIQAMDDGGYTNPSTRIYDLWSFSKSAIQDAIDNNVDGILCINDIAALQILRHLKQLNAKGIRVVGYDNISAEQCYGVELTSISTDKKLIAQNAVECLLDKISNFDSSKSIVSDVSLNIGET